MEETPVSKVMTRNPVFVLSDTLAVEALQKMVQGSRFSIHFLLHICVDLDSLSKLSRLLKIISSDIYLF